MRTDERDVFVEVDQIRLERARVKGGARFQRLRRRLRAERRRKERDYEARKCIPAEKAARGTERPRFLDRMPCRACAEPLTAVMLSCGVCETFTQNSKAARGLDWAAMRLDGTREAPRQPTADEWRVWGRCSRCRTAVVARALRRWFPHQARRPHV